jgi:anti-anti-sigma regulatory factor
LTVVQVGGDVTIESSMRLEQELLEAAGRGGERLLVDFCDCGFIEADALGCLVIVRRMLDRDGSRGPEMVLVADRQHAAVALARTGIAAVTPILRNRREALNLLLGHA